MVDMEGWLSVYANLDWSASTTKGGIGCTTGGNTSTVLPFIPQLKEHFKSLKGQCLIWIRFRRYLLIFFWITSFPLKTDEQAGIVDDLKIENSCWVLFQLEILCKKSH